LNSESKAIIKFIDPNPSLLGWHGGCGKIVCTGLVNILLNDRDGTLLGSPS